MGVVLARVREGVHVAVVIMSTTDTLKLPLPDARGRRRSDEKR